MYVVTVVFEIRREFADAFREEMVGNAQASLRDEPGCRQFDVCVDPLDASKVFLYEGYDSRAAFDAHRASTHFIRFSEIVAPWVASKQIRLLERIHPLRLP